MATNKVYNVSEAMKYLKMTNMVYFRKLIIKLGGVKRPHPSMPGIIRWEFSEENLLKYAATRKAGAGPRTDGRNRCVAHMTPAEFAAVHAKFPEIPLVYQNRGVKKVKTPKAVKATK